MKGLFAVISRELIEKRLVLAAALLAGLLALVVPLAGGLSGTSAGDARSWTASLLAFAFATGLPIGLGVTSLAPAIASRRIGFDLARPVSAFDLWTGRILAATLLAAGCAAIVWIPTGISGAAVPWRDLLKAPELPRSWPLMFLGGLVLLFAASHAASIAFRSRSALLLLDVALALAAAFSLSAALGRLPLFMGEDAHRRAACGFAVVAAITVLAAGYASVSGGRTEIRDAHRSLSLVLWIGLGAAAVGVNAYASWVLSASPADLGDVWGAAPAAAGSGVIVRGPARGTEATFVYDTASGRFVRARVVDWLWPEFSLDGRRVVWIEGGDHGGPFPVWSWQVGEPDAVRTRLRLDGYPAFTIPSPDGRRLATIERGTLSIHDLDLATTLASARVGGERDQFRGFFAAPDRFRLCRIRADEKTHRIDIMELDVASRSLSTRGSIASLSEWVFLAVDRSGDRLIVRERRPGRARLFDGRTGDPIATLAAGDGEIVWLGFLSDGRMVMTEASDHETRLRVFSSKGAPERVIPLPKGSRVAVGGEIEPDRIIVAIGDDPVERTIHVVDVGAGEIRRIADGLYPVVHLAAFSSQPNLVAEAGSEATKLFYDRGRNLVRLDPRTGERRVGLGKGAAP